MLNLIFQFLCVAGIFSCFSYSDAQTLKVLLPKSVNDIGNPLVDVEKCGRKGLKSYVCDPDNVLLVSEATQLDEQILRLADETECPCTLKLCKDSPAGFNVTVVIVNSMLSSNAQKLRSMSPLEATSNDEVSRLMDATLREARLFAYSLLRRWNLGRCNESVLIFYSRLDNLVYTVTSGKAREFLTDELVTEITMKSRTYFGTDKDASVEGLQHMIGDFKSVFLRSYRPALAASNDVMEKAGYVVASGVVEHSPCSFLLLVIVAVSLIKFAVF